MKKEWDLSEKIALGNFSNVQDFIRVKDVKEFIKRLKKEFLKERYFSLNKTAWIEITEFINKLAGEELSMTNEKVNAREHGEIGDN